MTSVRDQEVLIPVARDMFWFAPVPFVYHQVDAQAQEVWHAEMIAEARRTYTRQSWRFRTPAMLTISGASPKG